jgi:hypothetical protein
MVQFVEVLIPIVLMILLIVTGVLAFSWIRRHYLDDPQDPLGAGLTLHQLRTLKAQGMLNEEEYESARRAVLAQSGAAIPTQTPTVLPSHECDSPPQTPE